MSFSTTKTTSDYTSNTPGSSSRPAATNRPKGEENFSKLSRGRERRVGHAYDEDNATSNHEADPNIKDDVQLSNTECLPTPSDPNVAGPSHHHAALTSLPNKAFPASPRKATRKRSAHDAEVDGIFAPSKRPRREDSCHTYAVAPGTISSYQPEDRLNVTAVTTGMVQTDVHTSASDIKWDMRLPMDDPDLPAAGSLGDSQPTQHDASRCDEGDKEDFQAFLNSIVEEFNAKTQSPTKSGDKKQTCFSDPFEKVDRKHAVSPTASYRWRDLYNGDPRPRTGSWSEVFGDRGGHATTRAAGGDARHVRSALTNNRAPRNQLPPSIILGSIISETATASSSQTLVFAPSVSTPEVQENTSQSIQPNASDTSSDAPTTGTTPDAPFRYTPETEAEIRDAVLEASYRFAYSLFEPSERIRTIDGDEAKRFASEHPDKVTTVGRKAPRLWVCQATATWAADGTVTYAPAACGVACTSRDICMRHIYTGHLAKVRGRTAPQ